MKSFRFKTGAVLVIAGLIVLAANEYMRSDASIVAKDKLSAIVGTGCKCCQSPSSIDTSCSRNYTACVAIATPQCAGSSSQCPHPEQATCGDNDNENSNCCRKTTNFNSTCVYDGTSTTSGCPSGQARCSLTTGSGTAAACGYDECKNTASGNCYGC